MTCFHDKERGDEILPRAKGGNKKSQWAAATHHKGWKTKSFLIPRVVLEVLGNLRFLPPARDLRFPQTHKALSLY